MTNANNDSLDFARCQRADGSYYGTKGECTQKGSRKVESVDSLSVKSIDKLGTDVLKKIQAVLSEKMLDTSISSKMFKKYWKLNSKIGSTLIERERTKEAPARAEKLRKQKEADAKYLRGVLGGMKGKRNAEEATRLLKTIVD